MKRIKKDLKYPCYCCNKSTRGKTNNKKTCPVCKGTGFFKDEVFYTVITTKDHKQVCVDSDNQS